ncbi:hypothetical protein Tco_0779284 [Tanacetum coccineum]
MKLCSSKLRRNLSAGADGEKDTVSFAFGLSQLPGELRTSLGVPTKFLEHSSQTVPTLAMILKGQIITRVQLSLLPKRITPFQGDTFNMTLSPT